jgi:hypothetical protein
MTPHGFRSIASTLPKERGVNSNLIELQLAHADRNRVCARTAFPNRTPLQRPSVPRSSGRRVSGAKPPFHRAQA